MEVPGSHNLTKEERLSGKNAVAALLASGKWGSLQPVRYCYSYPNKTGVNRILVSVPKKYFKRAVRRNLVKRRIRESYRLQKQLLEMNGVDLMFVYSSSDIVSSRFLYDMMTRILTEVNNRISE